MKNKSGIYKIENNVNGKFYIGSSFNLEKRKGEHFRALRKNNHPNINLQRAWNKYGEENFIFKIVEIVDDLSKILDAEQFYIDSTNCCATGYNLSPSASNCAGVKWSEDSKKRLSEKCKGRIISEETKKKLSEALKGRIRSAESIKKSADSRRGKKMSLESCKKISESKKGRTYKFTPEGKERHSNAAKNRKISDEERKKISLRMMGNNNFLGKSHSEETKIKISLGNKGKVITEDQRIAISNKLKGRNLPEFSEDRKRRMSEAAKRRWENFRNSKKHDHQLPPVTRSS